MLEVEVEFHIKFLVNNVLKEGEKVFNVVNKISKVNIQLKKLILNIHSAFKQIQYRKESF